MPEEPVFSRTSPHHATILPAFLLFLCLFALYTRTTAPDLTLMDGVEYSLAGYTLGIPHPPGYPLFTILNKAAQLMPLGSIAWRSNLLCAMSCALAATLLFSLVTRRTTSRPAGITAALTLGLAGTYWENAVCTETYSLHMLFLVLLLAIIWRPHHDSRTILQGAFLCGLGLANHQVLLLAMPAVGLYAVINRDVRRRLPRLAGPAACLFILGISLYLTLPLRSSVNPAMDRGNPENLTGMKHVMGARVDMATANAGANPHSTAMQLRHFAFLSITSWSWPLLLLAVPGAGLLLRRDRLILAFLAAFWITQMWVISTTFYSKSQDIVYMVEPFFLPAHLVTAVLMGAGAATLTVGRRRIAAPVLTLILLLLPLPLLTFFHANDNSANYIARDWAWNVLLSAPREAVVLVAVDEYFPLAYLQLVEKIRPDLTPVHAVA
ncbi:DUF2723 domain-containing protein, partial [bacterium]|nr:DUF2723 domain-containing protein [candidate division CSSED10-310 bacterium]